MIPAQMLLHLGQFHDTDIEIGKQACQLTERRVDNRTVLAAADTDDPNSVVGERNHIKAPGTAILRLIARATSNSGEMITSIGMWSRLKIRPHRFKITLLTDSCDLCQNVEDRMRNLTSDHIDFICEGHRDNHIGVRHTGALENVRMGGMSNYCLHVECLIYPANKFRRLIDDSDVVSLR